MFSNKGYSLMKNTSRIFVKIESIDYDTFQISNKASVIACVGSRKHFRDNSVQFSSSEHAPNKVWSFAYDNLAKTSFVLVLYKYRLLHSDKLIGQIELNLKGLKPDTVTTHTFTLRSPTQGISPKVTLSIHVAQDSFEPFVAPQYNNIPRNIEMTSAPFFESNF